VKLFKKSNSKFYWYDFTVRGCRYRGSTQETKSVRALQIASRRLASAMENTDPLPSKPPVLGELAGRFLDWVNNSRLEEKTKWFYRNRWQLLKVTCVAAVCINQSTGDCAEQLTLPASPTDAIVLYERCDECCTSGGVEGDLSRSLNQNDERAWPTPSA